VFQSFKYEFRKSSQRGYETRNVTNVGKSYESKFDTVLVYITRENLPLNNWSVLTLNIYEGSINGM